jgi:hypothetical protein
MYQSFARKWKMKNVSENFLPETEFHEIDSLTNV